MQTHSAVEDTICVAARRTVSVASLIKTGKKEIVKPIWLFDCIEQAKRDFARGLPETVVPYEVERHLFFVPESLQGTWDDNTDEFGDPYARDVSVEELRERMAAMADLKQSSSQSGPEELMPALFPDFLQMRGGMFHGLVMYLDSDTELQEGDKKDDGSSTSISAATVPAASSIDADLLSTRNMILFAGGSISHKLNHDVTHIIVTRNSTNSAETSRLRKEISKSWEGKIPRLVSLEWIRSCWEESTRIDEERFPAL